MDPEEGEPEKGTAFSCTSEPSTAAKGRQLPVSRSSVPVLQTHCPSHAGSFQVLLCTTCSVLARGLSELVLLRVR